MESTVSVFPTRFGARSPLFLLPLLAVACGGDTPDPQVEGPMGAAEVAEIASATVSFAEPQSGAVVTGPDVRVVFQASDIQIAPVAEGIEGTGHHHLFINEDVTPAGQVIPANNPRIIHMGDGSSEYVIRGLEPGEYRLIAVVADLMHIPLVPPVQDTVFITVTAGEGEPDEEGEG